MYGWIDQVNEHAILEDNKHSGNLSFKNVMLPDSLPLRNKQVNHSSSQSTRIAVIYKILSPFILNSKDENKSLFCLSPQIMLFEQTHMAL